MVNRQKEVEGTLFEGLDQEGESRWCLTGSVNQAVYGISTVVVDLRQEYASMLLANANKVKKEVLETIGESLAAGTDYLHSIGVNFDCFDSEVRAIQAIAAGAGN